MHKFRHDVVKPHKNIPIILVSHSMGCQIALHYLKDNPNDFDSAILATPFVDSSFQGFEKHKIRALTEIACLTGFGHKRASRNNNIVRRIKQLRERLKKEEPIRMALHQYFATKNTKLRLGDPTFYWARNMLRQTNKLYPKEVFTNIKTPVLFAVCENDKLVNNQSIERAAKYMPNAKLAHIKDGYHALWTERKRIRDIWWKNIDSFLKNQTKSKKYNLKRQPPRF